MHVLVTAPYMNRDRERIEPMIDELDAEFTWVQVEERLSEDGLLQRIEGVDAIICGDDEITSEVIDRADRLKAIIKWGTGIDSINKSYANEQGIPVYNSPEAFTEPVADTTVGLMLDFTRNITVSDRLMKAGKWEKCKGITLGELTVGIIGMGHIGSAVARRLAPFSPEVLVNDIEPISNELKETDHLHVVKKNKIYRQADVITLHCTLNETTHHLLAEKEFDLMADTSPWVINTARGPLIKEEALIKALKQNQIRGAGLDVFEEEPLPESSPLRDMNNVLLSSHNANSSQKYWNNVHENCISYLKEALSIK